MAVESQGTREVDARKNLQVTHNSIWFGGYEGQSVSVVRASTIPKPACRITIVNPRKLEHGFRRISAGIPHTLP